MALKVGYRAFFKKKYNSEIRLVDGGRKSRRNAGTALRKYLSGPVRLTHIITTK